MAFNAKLGYSDKDEVKEESDWKVLTYAYNQTRPLKCSFTHIVSDKFSFGEPWKWKCYLNPKNTCL